MRLAELNPRWIGPGRCGVSFDCPCCVGLASYPAVTKWQGSRLAVFFANPIDGGDPHPCGFEARYARDDLHDHHVGDVHWRRTGDTFDTLTLSPSVDCSKWGHWHGFIQAGAVT